ncbi:RING-type domain-containing protein [Forsythia ovata]|uniref:RING-type domain-containing protein n=1 Tax=Forsythia ovata TaxID=205694 RepID=A0ABD1PYI5_9LAMI
MVAAEYRHTKTIGASHEKATGTLEAFITAVEVKNVGRDGITLLAKVSVHNPYPIATGKAPDPGFLNANDNTMLNVSIKVPYNGLMGLAQDIRADWDIDYVLDLGLIVDLPLMGNITIPVSYKGEMKIPTFGFDDDDNSSQNVAVGLDQAVINSYPKFVFSKKNGNSDSDTVCAICLCEYKESEMLRMLPDCKHYFHVTCVDAWLKLNSSCPVCRNSPLPTPLSTPLQEVVPLSQYSDGRRRT